MRYMGCYFEMIFRDRVILHLLPLNLSSFPTSIFSMPCLMSPSQFLHAVLHLF
jgi:hypothetical protein